jgi:serine/threonine-protein kinase
MLAGRYRIVALLGKGGMGEVYRAEDLTLGQPVALKFLPGEVANDPDRLARFRQEVRLARQVSHPNVCRVYDIAEANGQPFLSMEYVNGEDLASLLRRIGRLPSAKATELARQVCAGLAAAHDRGVLHRDLKPANVMIDERGRARIADFGLAGLADVEADRDRGVGIIMGTPGYMAPEQYAGADVDWRADVFSAGVVFYQLLTGVKPFAGSAESIAYKVCYETPPTPSEVDPERIQAKYDAVVMRAIAKKPEARFATAQAFRTALLTAYAAPVSPTVSEETVITEIIPTTIRIEPTSPSGHSGQSGGQSTPPKSQGSDSSPTPARTTQPPPGWDAKVLKAVEGHLARFVGPVAKVMIKRAGLQTTELDALYGILAENLATDAERKQFLATRAKVSSAPAPKGQPGARTGTVEASTLLAARLAGAQLTPEMVAAATNKLTTRLGPIAKVVVKKAALQATTAQQFYTLIAESLPTEPERVRFLEELGKS